MNLSWRFVEKLGKVMKHLMLEYNFRSELCFDDLCYDNNVRLVIEYHKDDYEKLQSVFSDYICWAFGKNITSFVFEVSDNCYCKLNITLKF